MLEMFDFSQIMKSAGTRVGRAWRRRHVHIAVVLLSAVWGICVCTGMALLGAYAAAPGAMVTPPARWPASSQIQAAASRPTLVLFAHPRCPCTHATIAELERLLTRIQGRVTTWVVFTRPADCDAAWSLTGLRQRAAEIPGVRILDDAGGVETDRFRARTSGLALLYDTTGKLLFAGGVTAARGHEGDNAGVHALAEIVMDSQRASPQTKVFGCALQSPATLARQETRSWSN